MWDQALFYAVSFPAVLFAVAVGLHYMPRKGTPTAVHIDVGLAWLAALSTLILVPNDVANALQGVHPELLGVWWRIVYWYGFVAQFTVLPFHQEYADSGAFHLGDRIVSSLRNNLIFYLILSVVGAAGLVLLLITGELAPQNIIGFCIAASNAFGLIAGLFLLGFGLVQIPRQLWRTADVRGAQRALHHRAGMQAERATAAYKECAKALALARKVSDMFTRRDPMRPYMDKILAMAAAQGADVEHAAVEVSDTTELDYFDQHDLGQLRRRVRRAIEDFDREREVYIEIIQQFLEVEDVLQNCKQWAGPFVSTTHGDVSPTVARLEWWWRCIIRSWVVRALAAVAMVLSLAVVVAEASISQHLPNLSIFSRLLQRSADNKLLTQLLTFAFLAYPCLCTYYALYKLGRFSFYLLVPGHTGAFSLLANAGLMCRFAAPLAFNFMAALALPPSKHDAHHDVTDTVFYAEFGKLMMRQPVFGTEFATFAPVALVPYILLLVCNAFNHVAAVFTRSSRNTFDDDWETRSPAAATGVRLLAVELENHRSGRELGLTIARGGEGAAEPSSGETGKRRWWPRFAWRRGQERAGPTRPPPSAEALDARSRLARAVGRVPEGRRADAGSGDVTAQLVPDRRTGSRSTGDLDSIFARMEDGAEHRPQASLHVESDSEDAAPRAWFWRK